MSWATQLMKEKGNDAFKAGDYTCAEALYSHAMTFDPAQPIYPLNRSMANLKLERWPEAEEDATLTLKLSPGNGKALFRRGVARRQLGKISDARQDIEAWIKVTGPEDGGEEELARIAKVEAATAMKTACDPPNPLKETKHTTPESTLFVVRDSPGKGKGAFATQALHRGDLILTERPLFALRPNEDVKKQHNLIAAVRGLSPLELQQFLSLDNSHISTNRLGSDPVLGIYATNSFQLGDDKAGICLQASRFNHSCSPNARYSWHAASGRFRIYALSDIGVDEEIHVSFISARNVYGSPRHARQSYLSQRFICICSACESGGAESDQRRKELSRLWDSIPYFPPTQTQQRLSVIARAVHLLREEGYAADSDDFTNDATAICAYHSDWDSARYWAKVTYETRVAEFGEDSERAAEVRVFLDPKRCPSAGTGRRQKFTVRL